MTNSGLKLAATQMGPQNASSRQSLDRYGFIWSPDEVNCCQQFFHKTRQAIKNALWSIGKVQRLRSIRQAYFLS